MSIYLPKHFSDVEDQKVLDIIESYPFATVMSFDDNSQPFFSHVPLAIKKTGSSFSLLGHVAKRNPQWNHFQANPKTRVIFHGPHTYITPKWYRSGRDVPTWNYVVVHVEGRVRLIDDFKSLTFLLGALIDKFESGSQDPWTFELPEDLSAPETLTNAIVGFEIEIEKVEAKFKLSQNRSTADKTGIIEGLGQRDDEMSLKVRKLMMEQSKS
jgi:transcriptional regulator